MKKLLLTLLITIFFNISSANAGCTPDGKCLIQFKSIYQVEKFINEHPYQVSAISIRPGRHFYIWYIKEK